MADLTASSVVCTFDCEVKDGYGKTRLEIVRDLTLTLSGHGTESSGSRIPAAALGLDEIYVADGPAVSSDNSQIAIATPDYLGEYLLLCQAGAGATIPTGTISSAVNLGLAPVALTGTFNVRVRGSGLNPAKAV